MPLPVITALVETGTMVVTVGLDGPAQTPYRVLPWVIVLMPATIDPLQVQYASGPGAIVPLSVVRRCLEGIAPPTKCFLS